MKALLFLLTLLPLAVSAAGIKVPVGTEITVNCIRPVMYIDGENIPSTAVLEIRFYHFNSGGSPGTVPFYTDKTGCRAKFTVTEKGNQFITATAVESGRDASDYADFFAIEVTADPTSAPEPPASITITF